MMSEQANSAYPRSTCRYARTGLILATLLLAMVSLGACRQKPLPAAKMKFSASQITLTVHGKLSRLSAPNPDTQPTLTSEAVKGSEHWQGFAVDGKLEPLIIEIETQMKEVGYMRMQPQGTPTMLPGSLKAGELATSLAYGRTLDKTGFIMPFWDFSKADMARLEKEKGKDYAAFFQQHPRGFMVIPITP